ncbi:MAG: rRNA maturation RNase YbeY [Rhodobacteraceae bacterium]|jgi:probable rRNA maturation factor|nr:rRNA maturation RNase YbeY [Paracoccaceae bacterium]
MALVDCIIEDDRWQAFGLEPVAEAAGRAALAALGMAPDHFAIALMACDDARIATLNADFRGKPQPTNVLSWPSEERFVGGGDIPVMPEGDADEPEELGDIAIAWETCAREAADQGKAMADHVTHLVVHAVLHLLGYDHIDDADADLMEATEVRILATRGIADPY